MRSSSKVSAARSLAGSMVRVYGRAALDRMMRMHRMIEDKGYPNCTKMSVEFALSVRTLRVQILNGLPIR